MNQFQILLGWKCVWWLFSHCDYKDSCLFLWVMLFFFFITIAAQLYTGLRCPSYHNVTVSQLNITIMSWYPNWRYECPLKEVTAVSTPLLLQCRNVKYGGSNRDIRIPPSTACPRSQQSHAHSTAALTLTLPKTEFLAVRILLDIGCGYFFIFFSPVFKLKGWKVVMI